MIVIGFLCDCYFLFLAFIVLCDCLGLCDTFFDVAIIKNGFLFVCANINLEWKIDTASASTENLLITTKLQRAPSLPRSYSRNRSGIPVANREPPVRGCSVAFYIANFLKISFFN